MIDKNLGIFEDPEALASKLSEELMNWIAHARGNRFDLAISGGSTPNLLFSALAARHADSSLWQKTHFWWVDERMVVPDDPESNYGTVLKLLLSKIKIPKENIHRIRGEEHPYQEAERYADELTKRVELLDGWPRFDLILLGMGEDGHTASIFPNQMELLNSDRFCEVANHPVSFQQRITLTGNVINHAAKICFLVTGRNKAERLSEIWSGGTEGKQLPAGNIQPVDGLLYWFADRQASKLLP